MRGVVSDPAVRAGRREAVERVGEAGTKRQGLRGRD